jgi:DnaK suppressor protein
MQTEWSPGRNVVHGSGFAAPEAPSEPRGEDVAPAGGPASDDAVSVAPAADEAAPVSGGGIEAGDAGLDTDAVLEGEETEGEEEAHRSAVDAVDGLLDEVELALARLDDGTYGRCEACGALIDDSELAVGPLVRECRPCSSGALALEGA